MLRTWHHGHSLITGAIAGLAIYSYAPYLLLAAGLLLGAAATCAAIGGYRLARTLLAAFEVWRENSRARRESVPF